MREHERLYLDGAWVPSEGSGAIEVVEAATEEVMGRVPAGVPADVDRAVAAARAAFPAWSQTSVAERIEVLSEVAAGINSRIDELADLVSAEVGMPRAQTPLIQVALAMVDFSNTAAALAEHSAETVVGHSLVVREPVGVVGAIAPWNFPLHQVAAKVAPALATGCTVVLKPSEQAPLTAFVLFDILDGLLPPGVCNLVTGAGPAVGRALVAHPGVDMVSFTGSTPTGRQVAADAAPTVKRVALELGGKSANLILDDADLERAVTDGVGKCYLNAGQACQALTRMLVPSERLAEAEEIAVAAAAIYEPGDPFAPDTLMGPLVSSAQRSRVREHILRATSEGARLLTGGAEAPEHLDRGYYVRPTVFSDVTPAMAVAREEIFGPVLALMGHDGDDHAVALANDSIYGLAGGVWSSDPDRALSVARRLRCGQVELNGAIFNPEAPFGGYRQSGNGRELGRAGLDEYLETKAIQR